MSTRVLVAIEHRGPSSTGATVAPGSSSLHRVDCDPHDGRDDQAGIERLLLPLLYYL
jgi:hypothetical protein